MNEEKIRITTERKKRRAIRLKKWLDKRRTKHANETIRIRRRLDLTQAQMAEIANVTPQCVQGWEAGRRMPKKYRHLFGCA